MGLIRNKEIRRRRARRDKLRQLRERYKKAKTDSERNSIIAKMRRVNPRLSREQFVAPLERRTAAA
jgi:hypothetical protein